MFSQSNFAKGFLALSAAACSACAGSHVQPDAIQAPQAFYTVTGEIALERHQPRVAALQYTSAAASDKDPALLARAVEVTTESLQPSLTAAVASRWISLDPESIEAHRAAARAALALFRIPQAAEQYRIVLASSPRGEAEEFAALDTELESGDDPFGARQLADRLAADFSTSLPVLRLQGFAALRADDPKAAARDFGSALALIAQDPAAHQDPRVQRELTQGLWRARILAGDPEEPLTDAQALMQREPTAENRLNYALLLYAAQRNEAAVAQLEALAHDPDAAAVALRLLALIEFQEGRLDAAGRHFTELLTMGKFVDDSSYYLGLIADRRGDFERALRLYAEVQGGDNAVPALLRAASILHTHGADPEAQQLLDRLIEDEPQRAPEILATRARIYADSNAQKQAMEVLDRAARDYPDSVQIRYAIASLYEEQGRVDAALRELKQVLQQRPDDPAALNAYGYTLADHDRELARARAMIERAYASAPKNPAILDSLGWVLFRQGHAEQALPYLKDAFADDRSGDIGAHLGEVLWGLGRHADAEHIWSAAQEADPDDPLLAATRRRLHAAQ